MHLEFFINNNKNVRTKNSMNNFSLVLQATYTCVEYALYNNDLPLTKHSLVKTSVCTDLMFNLCTLLNDHNITWSEVKHIIINQGPAPFTTLRGLIATVNGISFAQKIPLIAVDGLDAFTMEIAQRHTNFLIILNAFAGDFYYSFKIKHNEQKGCGKISTLEDIISAHGSENNPVTIIGNGILLVKEVLEKKYGTHIKFDLNHECVQLETIAKNGFLSIHHQPIVTFHVSPLYLKTASYQPSCLVESFNYIGTLSDNY